MRIGALHLARTSGKRGTTGCSSSRALHDSSGHLLGSTQDTQVRREEVRDLLPDSDNVEHRPCGRAQFTTQRGLFLTAPFFGVDLAFFAGFERETTLLPVEPKPPAPRAVAARDTTATGAT